MKEIETAQEFYRFISSNGMDKLPASSENPLFPDEPTLNRKNLPDTKELIKRIVSQPRIPELIRKWKDAFSNPETFTRQQAISFIQQMLESMESIDFILDYHCICGVSESIKNQWSDYTVYRPGQKGGWGLHLTVGGEGTYNCLRQNLTVSAGDLVLLSPTAFYEYRRHADAEKWQVYWVAFQTDARMSELLQWPEVGAGIHHLSKCDDALMNQFIEQFEAIKALNNETDPLATRIRYNHLENILLHSKRLLSSTLINAIDSRIQKAIQYIDDNFRSNFSVELVAKEACMSVSSLTRLFKQQTGLSVTELRNEKRMALACEKLTHSNLSISEVAAAAGYSDPLYFSRCFNKHFQQSPSAYREEYLKV